MDRPAKSGAPGGKSAPGTAGPRAHCVHEALFRQIFEASEDAMLILDGDAFVDCNRAAVRMLRCAGKDALLPAPPWRISPVHQPDGRLSSEKAEEMIRTASRRSFHRFEWMHIRADGEAFPVEVTLTPVELRGRRVLYVVWRDLTEVKRAEAALQASRERLHGALQAMPFPVMLHRRDGRVELVNRAWTEASGYLAEEIPTLHEWRRQGCVAYRDRVRAPAAGGTDDACFAPGDHTIVCKDGGRRTWVFRSTPFAAGGDEPGNITVAVDVTEQRERERTLRQAAQVLACTREGVTVTDARKRILRVNRAFTEITGYSEDEVRGRTPKILSSGHHDRSFYEAMWRSIAETGCWEGEIWNRKKSGEIYPEWLTISAVRDERGEVINYVGVFSDITHIKRSESELEYLAHYDPLTGLPNRALFLSLLQRAIARAKRHDDRLALLFCDLDRFKAVNDSFGHRAGDELLRVMGVRLRRRLRAEDVVARLGGDEFVVLMESFEGHRDPARVAEDLADLVCEPARVGEGTEVFAGVSIGISLFPDDADDAETLLQHADAAMHLGKQQVHARYSFYTRALTERAQNRLALEADLRRGLEQRQLTVHFQPLVSVPEERIVGAEALVRWQHPALGLIPPGRFIGLAEDTGLIIPLGQEVLRQACAEAARWHAAGFQGMRLAVNLSAAQLRDPELADKVRAVLQESGFDPRCLEFELTESVLMARDEVSYRLLSALRGLGTRLSIDDFGAGYSSLAYLQELGADTLKIDRRFIRHVAEDASSAQIVSAIVVMGHALGMEVLAEGVETRAQLGCLNTAGCDLFQGFLVSPGLPAAEFRALLERAPA